MSPALFTTVLVGSDGSDSAAQAVARAASLARTAGGSLKIIGAVGSAGDRAALEAKLTPSAHELLADGLEAQAHVRVGDPVEVLLEAAEEFGADLIVVGNRGMTGARRFILGSVPDKVSHRATVSVLIANTA